LTAPHRSARSLQATLVAGDEAIGRSFIDSFEETPVVLMAAGAPHEAVMRAVRLGAVDFLDKPLSHLKLKNIWQHSVRRVSGQGGVALP
jgi:FixJ family two-component response regulator